jgi:hypothetical protein
MKKLLFAFVLTGAVMLAQATGGSTDKAANTVGGKTSPAKTKTKEHKGGSGKKPLEKEKSKKGSGGTTTPPPK